MTEPRTGASGRIAALLGVAEPEVAAALETLVGAPVEAADLRVDPVPYVSGSPATASLQRVNGRHADGTAWSAFVKLLQHVRHWPLLAAMPPHVAASFAAEFPWRDELRLWHPLVQASLPTGLRSPRLLSLVELPEDRVAVWTEDVESPAGAVWDLPRFERAAFLLGRWNARSTSAEVLALSPFAPGHGLRMYAERSVPFRGLAPLADDGLWSHPWLADHADLRRDLRTLGPQIPRILDTLDSLPQCLPHGDASPQNLLVPVPGATEAADLVAIDVSFGTPHALGFDLGQLLVGLVHAGEISSATMPDIADVIVPAYVEGAAAEGLDVPVDTVRTGFVGSALLRSGFDALRLELLAGDPADAESAHAFAERVAIERFLADLALDVL